MQAPPAWLSTFGTSLSAGIARLGTPAFRRIYRYDRALRRKLTSAGWLLAAMAELAAVFGINTREVLVYQFFGLAAGLFIVAALASMRLRLSPDTVITRRLPQRATAGLPFDYTLTIDHDARAMQAAQTLWVEDLLSLPHVDASEFAAFKMRADRSRNLFDRLVGYPRWVAWMRWRIGARIAPVPLGGPTAAAGPGERRALRVTLRCLPLRRGILQFEAVQLARAEVLGLMKAHVRRHLPDTLLVLPRTHPVAPLQMPGGSRRLQQGGVANASRIGEAEEFVGLRDYRAGDTPRRIHWKAWARTGRPVVKEYQDEFFVRHALVLDTFGGGDPEAFETAVSLAASLVAVPRSDDSLLDLMFVEGRSYALNTLTQGRGLGAAAELLRVLAAVSPAPGGASFAPLAEAVALGAARISSAICVLLEWDEPRQRMVAGLRARGLPVRVWVAGVAGDAEPAGSPGPMASDPANLRGVHSGNLAQELMRP